LAANGVKLFREHQYGPAREAFSRAYELDPQSETLLELGLAELEAGRPVEASTHLREYLSRNDAPEAKRDVVRAKWLPRAEARTARLQVFVHAGAEIRIDGVIASAALPSPQSGDPRGGPLASIAVAAGEHEVSAREGTFEQSQHVAARAGELVDVHLQRPPPPSAPSAPVWTSARVSHAVATSGARWITAAVLESAALVATGVAIGFSVAVEQSAADANVLIRRVQTATGGNSGCSPPTPAPECPQVSRDRQSEHTNAARANGLYVGAGAFALAGAAAFLFWPSSKETSPGALHLVPVVADRAAGAGLVGVW
jgi:tetratricopeptide (TPR) repeat protein